MAIDYLVLVDAFLLRTGSLNRHESGLLNAWGSILGDEGWSGFRGLPEHNFVRK